MTRRAWLAAGLLILATALGEAKGGVFIIGGDVGLVHHIGSVARGSRIVVNITAKQAGVDLTCPMKVTLFFLADNNRTAMRRLTFRRNILDSRIIVGSAPISGEAVLLMQAQNFNHSCNLTFDASQEGTVPAVRSPGGSPGSIDGFVDEYPPEIPVPVNPIAAREAGLS